MTVPGELRISDPGPPARRSTAPFVLLAASLGALALFFLVRPFLGGDPGYRPRPAGTTFDSWYLVLAAFPAYAYALVRHRDGGPPVRTLLVGAAVVFAVLIPAAAVQSQDVYQYLVYGKMAAGGINPYTIAPSATGDPWLRFILWDDARTVYGPLWTALSAAVVRGADGSIHGAFLGIKAVTAGLAVAAASLLAAATRRDGDDGGMAVLTFAWNPLVVASVGVGAHADIGVAAAFAGAALAHRRGRPMAVTLLLVAATLVKLYAGLALVAWLVVLARRRSLPLAAAHAGTAAVGVAAAYSSFWEGTATLSGIEQIGRMSSASLTGTIERLIAGSPADASVAVPAVRIAALVLIVLAVVRVARDPDHDPWSAGCTLLGAYVLLSPWYLPWHLLGPLALAALVGTRDRVARAILTFSGTSLIVGGGALPAGPGLVFQTLLRYGPPLWVARFSSGPGTPRSRSAPHERSAAGRRSRADDTS